METTKMSSKGQVVIPQGIRNRVHADEGTIFAVMANNDTVVLKKMETPSSEQLIKQLRKFGVEGAKNAEKLGIKESDVLDIVHRFRQSKRKNERNTRY